jgi:ribA/ribD-fused uncharacterized protein
LVAVTTTPGTLDELNAAVAAGHTVKYLYFWGHHPQRDGSIGSGCLSQWWPAEFTVDGHRFPTAEHYMMWRKATLFNDHETAEQILNAPHPHQAKTLGRQVRGFDQHTWEQQRFDIVVTGSVAKFSHHNDLRAYLLGTTNRVLVEASPTDRVWGIGLTADDPRATDPTTWRGHNLLGFALVQARTILGGQH